MFQFATITNRGGREINEDAVGVFQEGGRFGCVLCDGLGGHGLGDVASALVKDVFGDVFRKNGNMAAFLDTAFCAAQDILLREQAQRNVKSKMKTTAVSFISDGKTTYIGHIGDSRLYLFRKSRVKFRTLDHSVPQMLALSHEIKESEIRNHHDRNIVLRVMGSEWEDERYELMKPMSLKRSDALLLCSDGFWELIREKEMSGFLKSSDSVDEWLEMMDDEVRRNGTGKNMDNYSAIAVWNV